MKTNNGDIKYIHNDHLGSTKFQTDETGGTPFQYFLFWPFGKEIGNLEDEGWEENQHTLGSSYKFAGKELDRESGLIYYGKRYYYPRIGRWISPDPLFLEVPWQAKMDPRNFNLYTFSLNNPIKFVDNDGLRPVHARPNVYRANNHRILRSYNRAKRKENARRNRRQAKRRVENPPDPLSGVESTTGVGGTLGPAATPVQAIAASLHETDEFLRKVSQQSGVWKWALQSQARVKQKLRSLALENPNGTFPIYGVLLRKNRLTYLFDISKNKQVIETVANYMHKEGMLVEKVEFGPSSKIFKELQFNRDMLKSGMVPNLPKMKSKPRQPVGTMGK